MNRVLNQARGLLTGGLLIGLISFPTSANADTARTLAIRLYTVLAWSNPSESVIAQMEDLINRDDRMGAAALATSTDNFINVTVRSYFAPMTSLSHNPVVGLNVMSATGMGLVRDDRPYTEILTTSVHYQVANPTSGGTAITNYSVNSDDHYTDAETKGINISRELIPIAAQGRPGYTDTAGLLTTDKNIINSFFMGTNRRGYQQAILNFMGKTLDQIRISGEQTDRVRRDVSRDNGGNVGLFGQECSTCHATMDPGTSAFNCYDTDGNGRPVFPVGPCLGTQANGNQQNNGIRVKVNQTPPGFYASGYIEGSAGRTDDFELRNPMVGWKRSVGKGAKEFGQAVSETDLFAQNAVERVWSLVCTNQSLHEDEKAVYGQYFKVALQYNLKSLFQYIASLRLCLGELGI